MVIGVISILSGLIFPAYMRSQRTAIKHQSKTQFCGLILALENYRLDHGHYPEFLSEQPTNLNGSIAKELIQELGTNPATGAAYYPFSDKERRSNTLLDGFNNPNIYIAVDTNNDGKIEHPGLPNKDKIIYEPVIIFTLKKDGKAFEDVTSWRN